MPAFLDRLRGKPRGDAYLDMSPSFELQGFFNGRIEGCGMIQDRFGRVTARFLATMECHWDSDFGQFNEVFTYLGDGAEQRRTWKVQKIGPAYFEAEANDILGLAQGHCFGNALQWRYRMDVPLGLPQESSAGEAKKPRSIRLSFDDWMWALSKDQAFNRSTMTKFGIKVAELSCAMRRVGS